MLEQLVHTDAARALAEALLQFLWEGAAAALVLALMLLACRSARWRYAAACLVLFALPVALGVTFWRSLPAAHLTVVHSAASGIPGAVRASALHGPAAPASDSWTDRLPWVTPVWVFGVWILYGRSLGSWILAQRLRRRGVCVAGSEWLERLHLIQSRLRMTRTVLLLESCLVEVPVVIGFLRPVILAPLGFLSGFPAEHVEAFLIHELAHVRRGDYLVNLAQTAIEGLLFYHPAVWWISSVVRSEREHCCDDVVVALTGDAHGYAAALTSLEQKRGAALEATVAATGGNLMKRIQRLLGADRPRAAAGPVIGLLLVTAGLVMAWTPQPPTPAVPPVPVAPTAPPSPVAQPAPPQQPDASAAPRQNSRAQRRAELQQLLESANQQLVEVNKAIEEINLEEVSEQTRRLQQLRSAQANSPEALAKLEELVRRLEERRLRTILEKPQGATDPPLLNDVTANGAAANGSADRSGAFRSPDTKTL
jgi:beta-lactamase regulating signal transducer with metallopeptidase domain